MDKSKIKKGLREPHKIAPFIKRYIQKRTLGRLVSFYRKSTSDNWEEYYVRTTKNQDDPRGLVGPVEVFDEQREWQYDLLTDHGLDSEDTLLDLGCGVLRGGIKFIEYLEPGNYVGMDISIKALLDGHRRIHENHLEHKRPLIIQNNDLFFNEFSGLNADFMIAQSVWTHLPPKKLRTCIENMGKALDENATILATVHMNNSINSPSNKSIGTRSEVDWEYPADYLRSLLRKNGYEMEILDQYHPTGQTVIKIERNPRQ